MTKVVYIYALSHPTTKEIRYVGKTENLKVRYNGHVCLSDFKRTRVAKWIKGLLLVGLKPAMSTLEVVNDKGWQAREVHWIAKLREDGADLLNICPGGEGGSVKGHYTMPEIRRQFYSNLHKGKVLSQECKELIRQANLGKTYSAQVNASKGAGARRTYYERNPYRIYLLKDTTLQVFPKIMDAIAFLGVTKSCVYSVLCGTNRTTYGYRVHRIKCITN